MEAVGPESRKWRVKSSGEKSEEGFEVPCRRLACGFPRQLFFKNNSININSLVFASLHTREKALTCQKYSCRSSSLWFIIKSRIAGQSTSASSPEERGESDCGKPWSSPKTWNGYAWNLPQLDWGWAVRFLCQYWLRDTDLVEALCSEGFWGSKQMNGAGGEHLLDHTGEGKGPLSALF